MTEPNIDSTHVNDSVDKVKSGDQDDNDLFSTSRSSVEAENTSASALPQKILSEGNTVDTNDNDDLFTVPDEALEKGEPAVCVSSKVTTMPSSRPLEADLGGNTVVAAAVLPSTVEPVSGSSQSSAAVGENDLDITIPLHAEVDNSAEPLHSIEILVSDPKKVGDGMAAYVVYKVTTRTDIKHFKSSELVVNRRFSDFLGLHDKLVARYQSRGIVVPPPPEKSIIGMTKVKVTKEETGSLEFVEKRRAALERFVNRVARHPQLCCDTDFVDFVELDEELPKASGTSTLSGAGFVRLLNRVGDSLGKYTHAVTETDEWFEDKTEELDTMDRELQQLHISIEVLVINRKDLSQATQQFARSIAVLGSTEEHMSLSRALSQLSDVETKVYQLQADQADTDFYVLSELVRDYVCVIQSVRDVLQERVKMNKLWKDAEAALTKKQDEQRKLEQQHKTDKLASVNAEINDLEQRVSKTQQDFNEISETIRKEIARFDRQKVRDFKSTIINYLQCMMNYQQQIATSWEAFLVEAKQVQ